MARSCSAYRRGRTPLAAARPRGQTEPLDSARIKYYKQEFDVGNFTVSFCESRRFKLSFDLRSDRNAEIGGVSGVTKRLITADALIGRRSEGDGSHWPERCMTVTRTKWLRCVHAVAF